VNAEAAKSPAASFELLERKIILLLCCPDAVHVLVFSAAFPPINNVAEPFAYDDLGRVITITNALGSFTNAYLGGTALLAANFAPFGKQTIPTHWNRLARVYVCGHI
jgi:hypothetical protein